MAYETGAATSPGDLLANLFDFAESNGFTIDSDIASAGQSPQHGHISCVDSPETEKLISLGFSFDDDHIRLHPDRGWTGSGDPDDQIDMAGDSAYTSNSGWPRASDITGPHTAYHFFCDNEVSPASPSYIHVVVEYDPGFYRHFGFGRMVKFGKWIGGEYYYGTTWDQGAAIDDAETGSHITPFDSRQSTIEDQGCRIFGLKMDGTAFDGLKDTSPCARWHTTAGRYTNTTQSGNGVDGNGADIGGLIANCWREPMQPHFFANGINTFNNFRPLIPIAIYSDEGVSDPGTTRFLGTIPDMRSVSMRNLNPGQSISVGGDTWLVFPLIRKGDFSGTDTEFSKNWGFAYKQVS